MIEEIQAESQAVLCEKMTSMNVSKSGSTAAIVANTQKGTNLRVMVTTNVV